MNERPLKFRIYSYADKSWHYFDIHEGYPQGIYGAVTPPQQFTGLTNKNGKEIYEGDILSVYHNYIDKYIWGEVFWINDYFQYFVKFYVGKEYFSTELKYIGNDWSIIGNIIENKELLEK